MRLSFTDRKDRNMLLLLPTNKPIRRFIYNPPLYPPISSSVEVWVQTGQYLQGMGRGGILRVVCGSLPVPPRALS